MFNLTNKDEPARASESARSASDDLDALFGTAGEEGATSDLGALHRALSVQEEPEEESVAEALLAEASPEAADLDALFEEANVPGEAEADAVPDLEALRRTLREKREAASKEAPVEDAASASDEQLDETFADDEAGAGTERLRWLVDFVGVEEDDAAEAPVVDLGPLAEETDAPAADADDLAAFRKALDVQQPTPDFHAPDLLVDDEPVTDEEMEALFAGAPAAPTEETGAVDDTASPSAFPTAEDVHDEAIHGEPVCDEAVEDEVVEDEAVHEDEIVCEEADLDDAGQDEAIWDENGGDELDALAAEQALGAQVNDVAPSGDAAGETTSSSRQYESEQPGEHAGAGAAGHGALEAPDAADGLLRPAARHDAGGGEDLAGPMRSSGGEAEPAVLDAPDAGEIDVAVAEPEPAAHAAPEDAAPVEEVPGQEATAEEAVEEDDGVSDALDPQQLAGSLHTDVQPDEGVTFRDKIESVQEEVLQGDGHLEGLAGRSADGHTLDAGGNTPVADVTNWMQGARPAPPADEAAADADSAEEDDVDVEALRTSDRVVAFLMRSGAVTPAQVQAAQRRRDETAAEEALWRVLAEEDGVDREGVFAGAARVYAFPFADLEANPPNPDFTKSVMGGFGDAQREQLLTLGVLPYRAVHERRRETLKLLFITHDPARPDVSRVLEQLGIDSYELRYAPEATVGEIIAEAFPRKNEYLERMEQGGGMAVDLGTNYQEEDDLIDEDALEAEISRSKLINLFEAALLEAVRQGASDLHIYPNAQKKVEIHFRVDGRLKHWHTEDKVHPEALLAVIKDNSMNVDRFERDAAQDGYIQRKVDGALIRFRVSVMPIANASQEVRSESIVIRVLDDRKVIKDLSKLGLLEGALERFQHAISQPHGMVIMTGPTGSGKSTTLVAALHRVVTPEVNVLTIEDPVEYIIEAVRQIKLSHKLKLEDALRSLLRHDPDVVMVGEMRDRSTAELAIKLANTGHLTFSTLHTNDAPSAISRLYKMGIEPFLIAYAINLVVAQRLIRTLCPTCKQVDGDPDPVMLDRLGFSEQEIEEIDFFLPSSDRSCPTCKGFGYKGRRAISEALYFSRQIRHLIVEADGMIDEDTIREQAMKDGMLTLQDSAREVVKMGETSVREMIRVVASEAH